MKTIEKMDNVYDYNNHFGLQTLNPLVSVIDFSKCKPCYAERMMFGFYTVFLKDVKCGDIQYGKNTYDYQEGTLVFLAPGQIVGFPKHEEKFQPKGYALLFHPDLIRGTQLARSMKEYTFFSYQVNEALHISQQEREIVLDCFNKISYELQHSMDKHSKSLIVSNIKLFLDYCVRFYERQFLTRASVHSNQDVLSKFEDVLDSYFEGQKAERQGLPTVSYCAGELNLSPNYFGDLIKKETGKSAQEFIQLKLIDVAKERVFDKTKSVSQVAYEMGFKYPQHFTRLFKKCVGSTPKEYREEQ